MIDHIPTTTGLSLMISCGCNLDCEYCRIAQAKNADSHRLQQATAQALSDGSFLQNVKNALIRLNISPAGITGISFWGQEPTLNLHLVTEHIANWLETFPYLSGISFSTNTVAYVDRIVDLLVAVDNIVTRPFHFGIQLSYDGEYQTDNKRGVKPSIIHDNLTHMFTRLNSISFKHVHASFNSHDVLTLELLKELQTREAIIQYNKGIPLGEKIGNEYLIYNLFLQIFQIFLNQLFLHFHQ